MRPYVLCHMMSSLDGKTDAEAIGQFTDAEIFEETHAKLEVDAWLGGRVTLQVDFGEYAEAAPFANDGSDPVGEDGVHVARVAESYAVAADTHGQIAWKNGDLDGDHVVALVGPGASKRYLGMLRKRGVSYVVAGDGEIDFARAFAVLAESFGVKRLAVEGGGTLNGAVLGAGLIDEVSLLLAPGVDGRTGTKATFDGRPEMPRSTFACRLEAVERLAGDVLWLRYRLEGKSQG